ncbi:MAG: SIMPL domain-containing protein [Anaerolineales bacterium]
MEHKPDTIKVSASYKEEIFATHADLHVTVKGSSLVSGNEAMKKAKEVNQLLEALKQAGVKEEAVTLQGVNVSTSTGAVLKSSTASYRLKIRCTDLAKFAEILDVIASQKNASLIHTEWKYDEDAAREALLLATLEKAKGKATKIAQTMGVKLLGVYDLIENVYDEETAVPYQALAKPAFRSAPAEPEPGLGMDVQHSKTIHVNVDIWYRVSEF